MASIVLDEASKKLAEDNVYLVKYIVDKRFFRTPSVDSDDLISIGNIALCRAAAKYKPDKGVKFHTYAAKSIINEIAKEFIRMSRQKRGGGMNTISLNVEISTSTHEELIETIADDTVDIEEQVTDKIIYDSIAQYVPTFIEAERQGMNITEYAAKNNIPKSTAHARVQRELSRAREKLNVDMVVA